MGCRKGLGEPYNVSLKESPGWPINHLFAEGHEYLGLVVSPFHYKGERPLITECMTSVK